MKEIVRYGFILGLICVVAGASLAVVNKITLPRIIAQALAQEKASLKEVMPEADKFNPIKSGEETLYYQAYKGEELIGVVFKAAGKGYSSVVETMVSMKPGGEIAIVKVLNQNETPGLGTRIEEPSFIGQFNNKNIDALKQVNAITGATISSKAVINAVTKKAKEIAAIIDSQGKQS